MVDITQIPQQELLDDKAGSVADIKVCELALLHDIKEYGKGESAPDRLTGNQQAIDTIDKEIGRRYQITQWLIKYYSLRS